MIGSGILSLPRTTAKIIGHDAWIAVLLGAFLPILSILLIHLLCNKHPNMDFVDLSQKLAGKIVGKILVLCFIVYCTMASGIICRIFLEAIKLFLLIKTPLIVLVVLILIAAAYLAACDIRILGRVNELIFYVLPICLIFTIPFTISHGDFLQLMPVMSHSFKEYMEAAFKTSFAFSGFEISFLAYAYVNKKEKILKAGIASIIITALIYFYIVVIALIVFGDGLVQKFTFPSVRILATAEIPVLERIEFLFLLLWITVAFKPICNQYFFTVHLIKKLFNMKSNKLLIIIIFPIIAAITVFPTTVFDVFKMSDYVGWLSLFVGIAIPLLLLAISLFIGGGKKHEAK
jgi:spore germination protein (amino acid permease)